jgi:hypothetical protein
VREIANLLASIATFRPCLSRARSLVRPRHGWVALPSPISLLKRVSVCPEGLVHAGLSQEPIHSHPAPTVLCVCYYTNHAKDPNLPVFWELGDFWVFLRRLPSLPSCWEPPLPILPSYWLSVDITTSTRNTVRVAGSCATLHSTTPVARNSRAYLENLYWLLGNTVRTFNSSCHISLCPHYRLPYLPLGTKPRYQSPAYTFGSPPPR